MGPPSSALSKIKRPAPNCLFSSTNSAQELTQVYTISWRQQQSHLNPLTSPALSSGLRCARRHALEADAFTNPQMSLGQIETFLATTSKRWSIVSKSSEKASLTP